LNCILLEMGGYTVMTESMTAVDEYSGVGFECGVGIWFLA